jgi:hypothetical protein
MGHPVSDSYGPETCLACDRTPGSCRRDDIAAVLGLEPKPNSPGNWVGSCPSCGHGGFALSQPTLTKMRHMWSCNCYRCNGGTRCSPRTVRTAMVGKRIPVACLGTYVGKDSPEITQEEARLMAQTIDDILASPSLKAAEMRILLAEVRGRKTPKEYGECAAFLMDIGLGRSNAYNFAERLCPGSSPPGSSPPGSSPPGSSPPGSSPPGKYPPQTGGESGNSSSSSPAGKDVKYPRSEACDRPENGKSADRQSKKWTESDPSEAPASPKIGQRTRNDKRNRRPAA